MDSQRYLTLAVHSPDFAKALAGILQAHGLSPRLENVCIGKSAIPVAVAVKLREAEISLGVKIAESGVSQPGAAVRTSSAATGTLLIPVDFSPNSMVAVTAGFEFAERLRLHPLILHSFAAPLTGRQTEFTDSFSADIPDVETGALMRKAVEEQMRKLTSDVKSRQLNGKLPDMQFSTTVAEGLPEEVIAEYSRISPPALIVMSTRGKNRREADLIGSVTAEVLDSCRVPVFTVPENITFAGVENITRLIFFCNLDRQDSLSVESLMKMFDYPAVDITLVPVDDRSPDVLRRKIDGFAEDLRKLYPLSRFNTAVFSKAEFHSGLEELVEKREIQLIIVPNKKTNIFARLFRPGIAHRILFERDMPMLALPV